MQEGIDHDICLFVEFFRLQKHLKCRRAPCVIYDTGLLLGFSGLRARPQSQGKGISLSKNLSSFFVDSQGLYRM